MSLGGCGLHSASRTSSSADWASWADSLRMIHQRHPAVANQMVRSLTQVSGHRHFVAAAACRDQLIACGFSPPTWAEAALARPRAVLEALRGWTLSPSAGLATCRVRVRGWTLSSRPSCPVVSHRMSRPHCLRIISSRPSCPLSVCHRSVLAPFFKVAHQLVRFPPLPGAFVAPSPPPPSSLVPLLSVWPSSRRPWPSPHKLPDFGGLGTSWIRPGVRCGPCLS